jgi:hypothetical protein
VGNMTQKGHEGTAAAAGALVRRESEARSFWPFWS